MKKALSIFFCALMVFLNFSVLGTIIASADRAVISLSTQEPKVGDNLIVALKYSSSSSDIEDIDATLKYDSSVLEYISGGKSSRNSTITIEETNVNKLSHSIYITFKAKAEGRSTLSATITSSSDSKTNTEEASTNVTVYGENSNNYLVKIGDKKYHIQDDLTNIEIPASFEPSKTEYNDIEINTITDNKKYTLFYLTADDDSVSDWFYINDQNEFTRLDYITCNNNIYIIENSKTASVQNNNWFLDKMDFNGRTFKAYKSTDLRLKDIYVLYCYKNGESNYYRYDLLEDTIQRAPDFVSAQTPKKQVEENRNFIESFAYLPNSGKVIFALLVLETLSIILLIVILVKKQIAKLKDKTDKNYEYTSEE